MDEVIAFGFRDLRPEGRRYGRLGGRGWLYEDSLALEDEDIPLERVVKGYRIPGALLIEMQTPAGTEARPLQIVRGHGPNLLRAFNVRVSARRAEAHRRELAAAGAESRFRTKTCTHCGSTVDLTDFSPSPQIYCRYCSSTYTADGKAP